MKPSHHWHGVVVYRRRMKDLKELSRCIMCKILISIAAQMRPVKFFSMGGNFWCSFWSSFNLIILSCITFYLICACNLWINLQVLLLEPYQFVDWNNVFPWADFLLSVWPVSCYPKKVMTIFGSFLKSGLPTKKKTTILTLRGSASTKFLALADLC